METDEFIPYWIYNNSHLPRMGHGLHHVWIQERDKHVALRRNRTTRQRLITVAKWLSIPKVADYPGARLDDIIMHLKEKRA
jgi:hypothetical protein